MVVVVSGGHARIAGLAHAALFCHARLQDRHNFVGLQILGTPMSMMFNATMVL